MNVTNLFDSQIDALVKKVKQLAYSNGQDKKAYDAIRSQVSAEYMRRDYLDMVSATLGELNDVKAEDTLNEIITHCSESFYFEDRILKTVVVPIGFHLKSVKDCGTTISGCHQGNLNTIANWLEVVLGSRKVVFDKRIYSGESLYYTVPRKMCEFLLKLEAGEDCPDGGPKPLEVVSKTNPDWEMIYLLGVEIIEANSSDRMNEEVIQRKMMSHRCNAEWALVEQNRILLDRNIVANAKCHGFYYLNNGVRIGEEKIRTYKLLSIIKNMEHGVKGVRFRYVHDKLKGIVRLLIKSSVQTIEHKWKMIGDEEIGVFQRALFQSIDKVLPSNDVLEVAQLDLFDFEKEVGEDGLNMDMAGLGRIPW